MIAMLITGPGKQRMVTNESSESLSIRVCEPNLVQLAGTRSTLEFVRECISQIVLTPNAAVRFPSGPAAEAEGGRLQMLRIRVDSDPLRAMVLGQHLVVTGMPQGVVLFCNALQFAALGPPGATGELRYHEGHTRIDRRSVAIQVKQVP